MSNRDDLEHIICEAPGLLVARSRRATTLIPYVRVQRKDGNINHGYIECRDRPDQIDLIPEAAKSAGFRRVLRLIAGTESKIMSGGCDCFAIDCGEDFDGPRWLATGWISIAFRDFQKNTRSEAFDDMWRFLLHGIPETTIHHIGFNVITEPLKAFFNISEQCYCVSFETLGRGPSEQAAWDSFEFACNAVADNIERCRAAAALSE